jgi:hypothetical protein
MRPETRILFSLSNPVLCRREQSVMVREDICIPVRFHPEEYTQWQKNQSNRPISRDGERWTVESSWRAPEQQ